MLNSLWIVTAWSLLAFRKKAVPDVDVLIMGTDPLFSIFAAWIWKRVRPKTKIVQWSFDLHEIAVMEGRFKKNSWITKLFSKAMKWAYSACDLVVDIGSCMQAKLSKYNGNIPKMTLTPWALSEPAWPLPIDEQERLEAFGKAKLVLAYSGSFSRSHTCDLFIELAERLKGHDCVMAFSVNGNRLNVLKEAISQSDANIQLVPFAPLDKLQQRLGASDIHLASLRSISTGCVVPSKFFGSLAVGRPVLFAGDSHSSIAKWIEKYQVGWVLSNETIDQVTEQMLRFIEDKTELYAIQQRCHQVYQDLISKRYVTEQWNHILRRLVKGEIMTSHNLMAIQKDFDELISTME